MQQLCLGRGRPEAVPRPAAVAEAGTVERDHTVIARQALDQAARLEVALRHHVAVNEDDRGPVAALDDVQSHAVDVEQSSGRWLRALGAARAALHPCGGESRTEQGSAGPETGAGGGR